MTYEPAKTIFILITICFSQIKICIKDVSSIYNNKSSMMVKGLQLIIVNITIFNSFEVSFLC